MARTKKNAAETVNTNTIPVSQQEEVQQEQQEPRLNAYATNAMRPVIIQKSLDGKRRAITEKMCEDQGVTKERLDEWKYNCNKLYEAACEYSNSVGKPDEATRKQEVWDVWRSIIRVGEEDIFHPNMFVRELDVENLRVLAAECDELHVPGFGFVPTVKGQEAFRSKIEIRLALRIASNKTLNDRQRSVITDYKRAENVKKAAEQLINGYTQGKVTVSSISAQIIDAENKLEEHTAMLKKHGMTDADKIDKITKAEQAALKNLRDQEAAAKKRLKKANDTITALKDQYDAIIDKLDSVEGSKAKDEIPQPNKAAVKAEIDADLARVTQK